MRVVITGAAGFLGSHLAERFLADGHEVVAVDNLLTGRRENVAHLLDGAARFSLVDADVSQGIPASVAEGGPVEGVLHLASPASPVDYYGFPLETLAVGSEGTRHALELARAHGARFLLASTSEVYGDPHVHPQTEDYWGHVNPIGRRSVYDEAKRFAEAITMAYHREHGIATRIVRIFNTYGPRMRPNDGRVVSNFIVQALRGESLTVYGDGSQTRSFTYVSDEADGLYRLFLSEGPDAQLPTNIGNPTEFTILELAELVRAQVAEHTGRPPVGLERRALPADDPKQRKPDITRARQTLGWEPTVPLAEGLRPTIEYFAREVARGGSDGASRTLPDAVGS